MKIRYIAILALFAVPAVMQARTLSPAEALGRIASQGAPQSVAARICTSAPEPVFTSVTRGGDAAVYVFGTAKAGEGFLVVSADDCAQPLLGYSDSGTFDPDAMPPQMKWWLEEYSRQIEYMNARGITAGAPMRVDRAPIAPRIKTDWDQDAPYNSQCPIYGASRCYTGCVATAMAQVMNYWKYPERGKGSISYDSESIQKRLTLNFSLKAFDWDNMRDIYLDNNWTDAEAAAVAYLMKACGYAVKMDYGTDSSGALAMYISRGLVKYFDYDPNISYVLRSSYPTSQWETMLYENLRDVGPVLYGGGSQIGGGHSFVCDGYDGNGYFHFNWGWTGMSNGYFSLDALDPYSLGAGGGSGGGYNFTQDAVLGIQPPTGKPAAERPKAMMQTGSLVGRIAENDSLKIGLTGEGECMWVNYTPETLRVVFGAIFEPVGNPDAAKGMQVSDIRFEIQPAYGTGPAYFKPFVDLRKAGLADGTYKVTFATRAVGTDNDDAQPWVPVGHSWGFYNYFTLTKSGADYAVVNEPLPDVRVTKSAVVGALYYGMVNKFKITVQNNSDIEISRGFAPAFAVDGQLKMLGESIMLTLPPHSTVEREWATPLYLLDRYFGVDKSVIVDMAYFDETTYTFFSIPRALPVVMQPNPGVPRISVIGYPKVLNAEAVSETVDGVNTVIYQIADKNDIQIQADVRLLGGKFAYPMYACVAAPAQDNPSQIALATYAGHNVIFDEAGTTQTFTTSVSFPECVPGQRYTVMMGYNYGGQLVQIGPSVCYFRQGPAGVGDVAVDAESVPVFDGVAVMADGRIDIYDLGGAVVATGEDRVDTGALPPGVYVARSQGGTLKLCIN